VERKSVPATRDGRKDREERNNEGKNAGQTENTQGVACIRLPADQQSSNTQPASGALKREERKAARLPVCPSVHP